MRKRVKLIWSDERGWHVDLPSYSMIPGSFLPIIPGGVKVPASTNPSTGKETPATVTSICNGDGVHPLADPKDPLLKTASVMIECPDEYADDDTGEISPKKISQIYSNNPRWKDRKKPPNI